MSDPIGRMDRRITIQRLSGSMDGAGQQSETWTDVATVWAQVIPQRGDERFQARQILGRAVTVFKIRYLSGLLRTDRIVFDGTNYDVHDIRILGRNDKIEIDASARAS